jgi:hypothetical protein
MRILKILLPLILLVNCLHVYESQKFNQSLGINISRLVPILIIFNPIQYDWNGNKKFFNTQELEDKKLHLISEISKCRCLNSYSVILPTENLEDYSSRFKFKLEIDRELTFDETNIGLSLFANAISFSLIPTWFDYKYKISYRLKTIGNDMIDSETYSNKVSTYNHLIFLFNLEFNTPIIDTSEFTDKILVNIYNQKRIPFYNY